MQWYRSWPATIPPGRAYVVDSMPRLTMTKYDYNKIEEGWPDDEPGFCMLEWDIALAAEEREEFAAQAAKNPDRVLVAPYYKMYPDGHFLIHRTMKQKGSKPTPSAWDKSWVPVDRWSTKTELFGFGCIYLPQKPVAEYRRDHPHAPSFNDTSFSVWYLRKYGMTDITWTVHPQHLHGD